jgi:hypothetical protein
MYQSGGSLNCISLRLCSLDPSLPFFWIFLLEAKAQALHALLLTTLCLNDVPASLKIEFEDPDRRHDPRTILEVERMGMQRTRFRLTELNPLLLGVILKDLWLVKPLETFIT